jgi:hypothetical protein
LFIIEPARRDRPHLARLGIDSAQTGLFRDSGKSAIAEVAVQNIAVDARDEDAGNPSLLKSAVATAIE